jgi:Matrixin/Carboxypeptidase regulatory-like domain
MRRIRIPVAALVLAVMASASSPAFVLQTDEVDGKPVHCRWPAASLPVGFKVNDRPLPSLPNLARNSTPLAAIEAAMQAWAIGPAGLRLDGTVATTDGGRDGINLITFANTPRNRDISANALAVTLVLRVQEGDQIQIVETDTVFNPGVKFATDGAANAIDIQATLTHELGHALGLKHSAIAAATMFPFVVEGETLKRRPEWDDIAGVRALYVDDGAPNPDFGVIAGQVVTAAGEPVFGAHVLATDVDGIARVGALTDREGAFTIPSLSAGDYQVYAEPLDGPMTPEDLPGAYFHDAQSPILTDFRTTFAGGNFTPAAVHVAVGETSTLDPIEVETQPPTLNPLAIAWTWDGNAVYGGATAPLRPQDVVVMLVAGPGLDAVPDDGFRVSSRDIVIDTGRIIRDKLNDGTPIVVFLLSVRAGARPGARNLYVASADEVAAYPGVIKVVAR